MCAAAAENSCDQPMLKKQVPYHHQVLRQLQEHEPGHLLT